MPSTRISEPSRQVLQQLACESGETMQAVLDKAVELYRRQHFLEPSNQAFAALRANPEVWRTEHTERQAWDITLADGLERE